MNSPDVVIMTSQLINFMNIPDRLECKVSLTSSLAQYHSLSPHDHLCACIILLFQCNKHPRLLLLLFSCPLMSQLCFWQYGTPPMIHLSRALTPTARVTVRMFTHPSVSHFAKPCTMLFCQYLFVTLPSAPLFVLCLLVKA